ncbi:MAG TPA: lantibiotic dehydratase [Candidatus Binatia bacterium]|nr:lantibiotic dehydratase [Candidatus Binatia bacterium]
MTHTAPLLIVRVAGLPFEALAPLRGEEASAAAGALLDGLESRAADAERLSALLYEAAGAGVAPELAGARGAVLRLRRAIHHGRALSEGDLAKAAPLLSAELGSRMRAHRDAACAVERARAEYAAAYARCEAGGRAAIAAAARDPFVRAGLRLAARELLGRADALAGSWGQRERHAASKVLAYLGRFAAKTSPNGLFCATGIGRLGDAPAGVRDGRAVARLDFALHVGEARTITACLAVSPGAAAAIFPRANPTLRREGDRWTLWRPASPRRENDDEVRLEIKDHPVLRMFLEEATGRIPAGRVIETVSARVGQDTAPFYAKLVERGVLIAEVEIPWSERRPLRALAARCPGAPWAGELLAIEAEVDALAQAPISEIPARIDRVASRLEALPHARPLSGDDLVRCDAATGFEASLPAALLAGLERLLPLYARFYGAIYPERLTRETFAARFLKRYPPDAPIPVLDFYHGLFEPAAQAPLSAFVSAASGRSDSPRREAAGRAFERARDFFAERARRAEAAGADEVLLSEADWIEIAGDAPEPRFSCAALFQVAAPSAASAADRAARVCLNALFPGAGLSVARLAHLHRPAVEGEENPIVRVLEEGWARRARPGSAFAEVTFMHGGRTANAGLRPPLFPLEIELPGDRATEGREAIPLADLTATWDSAAGRFHLRSVSRGIEIVPVISSGINPEGFVSFLTMVGGQDLQPLGLLPGFDHPEVRRWPRFRFENVILFRRRWAFEASELPGGTTAEERFLETQRWRRAHGLPADLFVHTDAEPKPFYANLDAPLFVDLMRRSFPRAARVHVTEMLPGPADLWMAGTPSGGRHATEFLAHIDNLDPATSGTE